MYVLSIIITVLCVLVLLPLVITFTSVKQHKDALSLPKGSVRALLTLAITGVFLCVIGIGPMFIDKESFTLVVSSMSSVLGAVIGFYFGTKNGEVKKGSDVGQGD